MMSATEIDPQKLEAVMGQAVLDLGAAISAPLFVIGDRLGLYKAMAAAVFDPVGRIFYGASTMICTPASLDQEVGLALGAQAGQERLTEVIKEGGFESVRRATETPFNLILEAKP
jgi:hypothetical protein